MPKVFSIEDFGVYKTFTLYLSYTSLLHFGYKDGLYIWLCKNKSEEKFIKEILSSPLFYQQILISLLLFFLSFVVDKSYRLFIVLLSLATFFNVCFTFFESFLHSLKKFKPTVYFKFFKESIFFISIAVFYFLGISVEVSEVIALLVFITMLSTIAYWLFLKWNFFRFSYIKSYFGRIKKLYHDGFFLISGNVTHQLSINIDKLFISFFFSSQVFGIYAFGSTFFVLANLLLSSLSTYLLPFLFDDDHKSKSVFEYPKIITYPFKLLPVYIFYFFCVYFLINNYYQDYIESIKYFAALNLALIFNIGITIVQNNFLKSLGLQKQYSKSNLIIIVVVLLILLFVYYFKLNFILIPIIISLSFFLRFIYNDLTIRNRLKLKVIDIKTVFLILFSIIWWVLILIYVI